jgi:hypothetical protein
MTLKNGMIIDEQRTLLEADRETGLISEEEFNERLAMLEQQRADTKTGIDDAANKKLEEQRKKALAKENAQRKKVFEAEKKTKIASVWIQFAVGTIAAFAQSIAQLGPIAGAIMGGVLTALLLGLAIGQTAAISKQQFIPARKRGGRSGGLTRINEEGGEIQALPDGTFIAPHDISMRIADSIGAGGGGTMVNVSFAGANIYDEMSFKKMERSLMKNMAKALRSK